MAVFFLKFQTMNNVMTKESNRLLAAIMFTDMVGYTALMQENEELAKQNRDRHRKIQQEATSRHRGKILQYYGDGTLIIFNSAIEAVGCAVDIQTQLQKDPPIPLRIGIHTGDIVHDDEGIYGDGVNIASRIEGLSTSGSVLISDKLADDLKNQPGFGFTSAKPPTGFVLRPLHLESLIFKKMENKLPGTIFPFQHSHAPTPFIKNLKVVTVKLGYEFVYI